MPIKDIFKDALNFFHLRSNFYFLMSVLYIVVFFLFELLPGNNLFLSYSTRYESIYSSLDYLITLIYLVYDVFFISFCAVWIHNTFILGHVIINKIFFKKLIRYSIFLFLLSLVIEKTFISGLLLHFARPGSIDSFFDFLLVAYIFFMIPGIIIFGFLVFFWFLYMPNLALGDGISFFKFFKLSKGYRWSFFKILLIQFLIVIPFLLFDFWLLNKPILISNILGRFGDILLALFIITCISSLYKKFRKEVLNLD